MTQCELNQAVARATGESLGTVSNMGFGMADPMDVNYDPEPPSEEIEDRILDWDQLDRRRRMPLGAEEFRQPVLV